MESLKVRLAAVSALRYSLAIFLTAVLGLPFVSVIKRIFDGSWHVNWRLTLSASGILTACVFSFFFLAELLEDLAASKRENTRSSIFPGVMWLRGIYLFSIVMGFTLMVGMYREHDSWKSVVFLPAIFVLLGYFPWPWAIRISEIEVRQRGPFLNLKRIPFREIESVYFDAGRSEVVVFAKNGVSIVHSAMHSDTIHRTNRIPYREGSHASRDQPIRFLFLELNAWVRAGTACRAPTGNCVPAN